MKPELSLDADGVPELIFSSGRRLVIDLIGDQSYSKSLRGKQELIAKACGFSGKPITVIDATMGLGQDTWTLARLGCQVLACEREPLLFELFSKALERASRDSKLAEVCQRIQIFNEEAHIFLRKVPAEKIQTIFLDPMFPDLKKSALPKIEMQLLRDWLGHGDSQDEDLLKTARSYGSQGDRFRVVVKRPSKAPLLAPDFFHQFKGNSIRYDCYKGVLL